MSKDKIDFVILWVDGNDPEWIKEKNKYSNVTGDKNVNRFRDANNLQYLFRGIEKHANWVNKIFFITWGHLPKWLNIHNPKIRVVRHEDFIPKEYLPTFNSNVIELNLHRIEELSEKFVLFNDDLFILQNVNKEDFFKKELPNDVYVEYTKKNCSNRHKIIRNNCLQILSKHFVKKYCIKKNLNKVFNLKYGFNNFRTLLNLNNPYSDFISFHLTQSFLKSTFYEVWNKNEELLSKSCYNRFRSDTDIGRGIFRYWQLLNGNFVPHYSLGKYFTLSNKNNKLIKHIKKRKNKIICINDTSTKIDFEKSISEVNSALKTIFPDKSNFEK